MYIKQNETDKNIEKYPFNKAANVNKMNAKKYSEWFFNYF